MIEKKHVDFGKTSKDYAQHRAGFPKSFFDRLTGQNGMMEKKGRVLDVGTGTGTVARNLALLGFAVTGLDIAQNQLDAARKMATEAGAHVNFVIGTAEKTGQMAGAFDYVTAGQCWHWFDAQASAREVARVLAPKGRLVIAHFDWADDCAPVAQMYRLRKKYNPAWTGDGVWPFGYYPQGPGDIKVEGFSSVASFSYMEDVMYTQEGWRGRMRSYSGIGGSLPPEAVEAFDAEFKTVLAQKFEDDVLRVPHHVWAEAFETV